QLPHLHSRAFPTRRSSDLRTTHEKRMQRLAEAGTPAAELAQRLMSPIGLDIGARTPEETAISICAEIIASRTGRQAPSLRDGAGDRKSTRLNSSHVKITYA